MKFWWMKYIQDRAKILICVLLMEVVMIAFLIVNRVPLQDTGYAVSLICFLFVILLVMDGYDWWRRYKSLDEIEQAVKEDYVDLTAVLYKPLSIPQKELSVLKLFAEKSVQQQNKQARKQKDLEEYYGMWVHQIKTPIASLRLLLQQREQEGEMAEEQAELFRIEQYVDMALQYLRIDAEYTDFAFRQVALDEVIRGAIRKYARQFIYKKICLSYQETQVQVLTDEKWMGFVVEQILSNALKYTAQGTITIKVESKLQDSGECAQVLIIEDTGIGIRAEDLPRICEKGYTGYNGHHNQHSTGIGLYLCSRITKKLGHTLLISSQEGIGTKVEIVFAEE